MSAPQIPNLNTLRRGGLRSRAGGAGGVAGHNERPYQSRPDKDSIIQNTDNDAATSRLSAVDAGYLDDAFAKLLSTNEEFSRRLPLMNRGTYVRTTGIDCVVGAFISSQQGKRVQIISLGAGSDTRFFRLKQQCPSLDVLYHELDFEANTRSKIARLRVPTSVSTVKEMCHVDLQSSVIEILDGGARLRSPTYCIHPVDLRTLHLGRPLLPDMDTTLPTLLISECCLVYLSPDSADAVLQYFTQIFHRTTPLAIIIYEPIRPHDPFGRTMISNLTSRGIQLQTIEKYADLEAQRDRLRHIGFDGAEAGAEAADIDVIWRHWVDDKEKSRIDELEWMDEVEEFVLLARHYCISWAWKAFEDDRRWRSLSMPGRG